MQQPHNHLTVARSKQLAARIATLLMILPALFFASCHENDDTEEEFPDWQATNEAYYDNLYAQAKQRIAAGDTSWKIIRNWSFEESVATEPEDFVIVQVLEEGTGSGCPLYTDSVRIHYSARLLPSTSYSDGYEFSKSYYGTYDPATAVPSAFYVGDLIDGFTTALMHMHIGDRWKVYIPHQLGYGASTSSSTIQPYSTLIYDVTLHSYYRAGTDLPDFN